MRSRIDRERCGTLMWSAARRHKMPAGTKDDSAPKVRCVDFSISVSPRFSRGAQLFGQEEARTPPLEPADLPFTVRCTTNWHPGATWGGCWRQGLPVRYCDKVVTHSASRAYFTEDASAITGIGTGSLACCHVESFLSTSSTPRYVKPRNCQPKGTGLRSTLPKREFGDRLRRVTVVCQATWSCRFRWPFYFHYRT